MGATRRRALTPLVGAGATKDAKGDHRSMSKKLIMTICVGILALSASALASSASAEWMLNGVNVTGTQKLATTAAVDENGLLKAAGVTIECTGKNLEGTNPQIEVPNKGSASALIFTECESITPTCKLNTKTIGTVPLTATVALVAGSAKEDLATFLPKTKTIFATIKYEGAECALLGTQPVSGKALVKGPTGQEEKTLQEIVANVSEETGELKVGSSPAELKGAALLKLASGNKWSYL